MRACPVLFGALVAVFAATQPSVALGETPAENKAAARELTTQGILLAEQGKCDEAIPLFERAKALFHAPTILMSLGECQIQSGLLVAGTETLNRVARERLAEDAPAAFLAAREKARALLAETNPRIAKLVINLHPNTDNVRISIDGVAISEAFIGVPRPTDPGARHIEVAAEGYELAEAEITLAEGASETVTFELRPIPAARAIEKAPVTDSSSGRTVLTYVTIGVGSALLVTGGVTGFMAMNRERLLQERCPNKECPSNEEATLNSARSLASVSTIATIAGAAVGLTGLVLLLTNHPAEKQPPAAQARLEPFIGLANVGLSGTF